MRKIVHVETNLSNKLREEHPEIFAKYGCRLPKKNFRLPSSKELRPVALHFWGGGLMIVWVPVRGSEFEKWLSAFNLLRIKRSDETASAVTDEST